MSLTNPKDFIEFYNLIPKEKRDVIWFFPIRRNQKVPECLPGTTLKENKDYRLTYSEALNRLKWGSNVGIYAIPEGLCFLDLDVREGKILASPGLLDTLELIPTLTVKTRNGGIQKYYWNDGKYANQILKENGVVIGELRTNWFYVVAVGSYVPSDENCRGESDGTYRIQQKVLIAKFDAVESALINIELKTANKSEVLTKEKVIQQGILEHEKPENRISNSQHILDLLQLGYTSKIRRKHK